MTDAQHTGVQTPLMREPPFLALWGVGALNSTGRWLETLVIAIFVLDVTGSPFWVASMLMLRLLPLTIFGLFGGMLAHRFERWRILRVASGIVSVLAMIMWWLAQQDALAVWHVGVLSFISGLIWSTDFPVRRTLMGEIAGPARVGRAMSIDITAGAITRTLGPLLGGVLYASAGLVGAFVLSAVLYVLGLILLLAVKTHAHTEPKTPHPEQPPSLAKGWAALRSSPTLPGILAVTIIFNLWGFPFISMVPVYAKEILDLGDALTGVLVSMEGAGAFLGAMVLSVYSRSEHMRYLYSGAVMLYCALALAFSMSSTLWLAVFLLVLVGFFSAGFGAMQSALILVNAPQGMQRQMMAILSVCIGTAPLGLLHIGLLADIVGPAFACTIVAGEGLLAMLVALWRWPQLLSEQPLQSP